LSAFFRRAADRLAELGYTVLVPDLNQGALFENAEAAQEHLGDADANRLARLTLDSAMLVQEKSSNPAEPISVVGFSMGASLGLWASIRLPDTVGAVAAFYGTQSIDFLGARAAYQIHLAGEDHLVDTDEAVLMEATMSMEGLSVESFRYPGTRHWFFEADRPEYDSAAADLAWERLIRFLGRRSTSSSG
jgi:carboxymethylenebutenolidase